MIFSQQEKGDSVMTIQKPTEADARSLAQKLAAFAEGLEPGERTVLFKSLPKMPEEEPEDVQGHSHSLGGGAAIGGCNWGILPPLLPPSSHGGGTDGICETNFYILYY
jgi:hypothetical protein